MKPFHFIARTLRHFWRIEASVALGVVAATAVLTGALIVGDSVRGSLRYLTINRLGRIDQTLISSHFFRASLAEQLADHAAFQEQYSAAVPVLLLQGTVETTTSAKRQANRVTLLGIENNFWQLGEDAKQYTIAKDEIILNRTVANALDAKVGEEIIVRIPRPSDIPSDSPLGEKIDTVQNRRLRVARIIPSEGLGRFGLNPSQQQPLVAFINQQSLQSILDRPGKVNAIFVAANDTLSATGSSQSKQFTNLLATEPEDLGLRIERITIGKGENIASDYFNITSEQMILPDSVVQAALKSFGKQNVQPVLTYLANTIRSGDKKIPYSTVSGLDVFAKENATSGLGPYDLSDNKPLADDEIILNSWAADQLAAKVGDKIILTYYPAESTHGQLVEASPAQFRLRQIVPLAPPGAPPTRANDPDLTPELKGVTDQQSIDAWELPFELTEKIRQQDEDYWDAYRTTPKAFVSLETARRLWGSRFGNTSSLRIPALPGRTANKIFEQLQLDPEQLGFAFQPIKQQALQASAGTTPFNALFLGFSFFIIASAVMLVVLLFRLAIEKRAKELGLLLSVGISRRQLLLLQLKEFFVVALGGSLLGAACGIAYAWLMLTGLSTLWLEAITSPFLKLYITPTSIVLGIGVGLIVSLLAIYGALRQLRGVPLVRLLAGQTQAASPAIPRSTNKQRYFSFAALLLAVLLGFVATRLSGEAQAGAFFGAGTLILASSLSFLWIRFQRGSYSLGSVSPDKLRWTRPRFIWLNIARNPSRSTLTVGLISVATFLIVAISAFRLAPSETGTGRFTLVALSDQPIVYDLNSSAGRLELGFNDAAEERLAESDIFSLRVQDGDDASCLNLYQARQPRVLGVPPQLIRRGGFAWAANSATTQDAQQNPWQLLEQELPEDRIPVVLDMNTALYSLHLYGGPGSTYTIEDENGKRVTLEVVGLLKNSIFQGDLLISEKNFLKLFPHTNGYRFFLIDQHPEATSGGAPAQPTAAEGAAISTDETTSDSTNPEESIETILQTTLTDYGFSAESASGRLARFLAVQNTYLSTFQSLGMLGLLLGTFGLAAAQLRSILERRGELALLRATGLTRHDAARLISSENQTLTLLGLKGGLVAALFSVLPHYLFGGAAIPWLTLVLLLSLVLLSGWIATQIAIRAALSAPILVALREE